MASQLGAAQPVASRWSSWLPSSKPKGSAQSSRLAFQQPQGCVVGSWLLAANVDRSEGGSELH
ncbi:MAG TPA: hypothetical protein VER04_24990, partial [Polyangiaceae bacterium]|nr:hypothetical protein [Polyangiaceae bacterium]